MFVEQKQTPASQNTTVHLDGLSRSGNTAQHMDADDRVDRVRSNTCEAERRLVRSGTTTAKKQQTAVVFVEAGLVCLGAELSMHVCIRLDQDKTRHFRADVRIDVGADTGTDLEDSAMGTSQEWLLELKLAGIEDGRNYLPDIVCSDEVAISDELAEEPSLE